MIKINEGDYFRWSYKSHILKKRSLYIDPYWCKSQIATARNGRLVDTYWSTNSSNTSWSFEDAIKDLDLKLIANEEDMVEPCRDPKYYDPKDVFDIRHANLSRGGIYIRKGAKPSKIVMVDLILFKINEENNNIKWANQELTRLYEKLSEIETADLEKFYI